MADEAKPVEPGVLKKAFEAVGNAVWNLTEKIQGKESTDAAALALLAYSEGRLKDGARLATESQRKAAAHLGEQLIGPVAMEEGARSLAAYAGGDFIEGAVRAKTANAEALKHGVASGLGALSGHAVIAPDGAPTTPTPAGPKRSARSAALP